MACNLYNDKKCSELKLYSTSKRQFLIRFEVFYLINLEESTIIKKSTMQEKNVIIDHKGRRIVFDTIHGVKGETHDATLYLETDRHGASDLNRILHCFGVGKIGNSSLCD